MYRGYYRETEPLSVALYQLIFALWSAVLL